MTTPSMYYPLPPPPHGAPGSSTAAYYLLKHHGKKKEGKARERKGRGGEERKVSLDSISEALQYLPYFADSLDQSGVSGATACYTCFARGKPW